MNGWIKLHRKILDHQVFKDQTAFMVFMYILLSVDHKTGETSCGRFQLSKILKMKPTTAYQALLRLQKWQIVTLKVTKGTNKYTIVRVNKWKLYQSQMTQLDDNPLTIKRQSNDTLQEVRTKNKEVLTFKEQNKIAEDREKQKGYWKGELSSAKELKRSCEYTGRDPKEYDKLIEKAQVKLAELG